MAPVVPVPAPSRRPPADGVLRIDCDECALQATDACGDCVVTFLCGVEAGPSLIWGDKHEGTRFDGGLGGDTTVRRCGGPGYGGA